MNATEDRKTTIDDFAYLALNGVSLDEASRLEHESRRLLVEAMKAHGHSYDAIHGEMLVMDPKRPDGAMLSLFALTVDDVLEIASRGVFRPDDLTLNEIRILAEYVIQHQDDDDEFETDES